MERDTHDPNDFTCLFPSQDIWTNSPLTFSIGLDTLTILYRTLHSFLDCFAHKIEKDTLGL